MERLIAAVHHDNDGLVRGWAVEALGDLPSEQTEDFIIALLEDEGSGLHRAAAKALGKLSDAGVQPRDLARVVQALSDALAHDRFTTNWTVRLAEVTALETLNDERAVKPLRTALEDRDSDLRQAAVKALQRIGGSEAEKALREHL